MSLIIIISRRSEETDDIKDIIKRFVEEIRI